MSRIKSDVMDLNINSFIQTENEKHLMIAWKNMYKTVSVHLIMINILKAFSSSFKNNTWATGKWLEKRIKCTFKKRGKHEIEIQSCRKVKTIKFCWLMINA